jgi:UDP-glucose:(heptosyl)LPS alpha-1,3-glucosyltransferase
MTPYRLAFFIERYFEFGGLQRDMRRFALACAQAGHEVTVFTSRWEGSPETLLKVEIVNFKSLSNHGTIRNMERFIRTLRRKSEFDCLVGFNRAEGLDVYFGGDICLKAKLLQQNRMWLRFLPRYHHYLKMEAAVLGPKSKTDVMLISPLESEMIRQVYKTAPERIHLLPPGIDRDRLAAHSLTGEKRNPFREEWGVGKDDLLILTVGSSFRTKGIDRVIHAIANLPETLKKRCRYGVVGLGDTKKFHAIAHKAGIGDRVKFAGGRQDITNFYYAADILAHPARTETTGAVILEAMITGLPVVVTKNCGYASYIQKANAGQVLSEPFDQKQFNHVLKELLLDSQRRLKYADNGREYGKTSDLYRMINVGVEVILNRAEKNRGRR